MAPRPMPVRSQQSRTIQQQISQGAYSKENPQGKISVFNDLKKAGLIPQEFQDAKHLADVISVELEKGKSVKEVLAELKVKLGSGKFDKQGNIVGRQIRNMLNPVLAEAWDKSNAGLTAEQLAKLQRKDWSYKVNELKEWARRLGIKQDVGHFDTSAGGAPQDVSAAGGENADANQAAGRSIENPPRPADKYLKQNVGISSNPVEGLSETAIRAMGEKTRGGTRYPLHPLVSNLLGTTLYGQTSNLLEGVKGGIEQFNRQFEALVDQKLNPIAMYDYVKSLPEGKAINIKEMAKAGLEEYDLSKYHPEVLKAEQVKRGASPVRTYQMPKGPTVTTRGVPKGLIGPIGAGLAIGGALLSDNPAQAIPVAAETLTPLGDIQGAPEPAVTMVNVGGKLRPLNTDTNTLMDKPGYGLEQKGGQWREVKRGTGAASRQQSEVQAEQLIPVPRPVMANTPTGVAQLKAMPKSNQFNIVNELTWLQRQAQKAITDAWLRTIRKEGDV